MTTLRRRARTSLINIAAEQIPFTCYHFTRAGNAMKFDPLRCRHEKKITRVALAQEEVRSMTTEHVFVHALLSISCPQDSPKFL